MNDLSIHSSQIIKDHHNKFRDEQYNTEEEYIASELKKKNEISKKKRRMKENN